jgi:adenosylcobinamide-phosphate synthase
VEIFLYPLAFLLDLLFKDIELWPHPVRFIGATLVQLEKFSRKQSRISLKYAGLLSLCFACVLVGCGVLAAISLPVIGILFKVYFAYAGLSLGGLLEKGKEVLYLCEIKDIDRAKRKLSYLVSRDTSNMKEEEILKSLAETLSENFNDGFVAPFFYLLIGGPTLLWIYKTVSTMDSMWGYKTKKWKELGWAGARMDDILGFLPARISFLFIFLMGFFYKRDVAIFKKMQRAILDAKKMESPNAGWPMAAVAWIFESKMGGEASYFGKRIQKPHLGGEKKWDTIKIKTLIVFLLRCGILCCICMSFISKC